MKYVKNGMLLPILVAFVLMLNVGCSKETKEKAPYKDIHPAGDKPVWGPTITGPMLTVIEALDSLGPKSISTLTPAEARLQPTPADAVLRVMQNYAISAPAPTVDTVGQDIAVTNGTIHVRIYTPKTGKSSYPVIVYYHGGGWVIATNDTYNASAQALSEKSDAILIAVEYRKGPEFKFPAAHSDAFDAYKWALANASNFKGDSTRIAVAGESAGGNMAITVSMMARDSGVRKPVYELSIYPVASNDLNTTSKIQYKDAKPLGTPALPWFLMHYLNSEAESASPFISLVNADLTGLPPTTIIGAEIDPLQSEGKELSDKLTAAGVTVKYTLYRGVTHEFFGMGAVVPEALDAENEAAGHLKTAFQ